MKYRLFTDLEQAKAEEKTLNEGYPKPPTHVGWRIAKLVPAQYSLGAIGWTERAGEIRKSSDGQFALSVLEPKAGDIEKLPVSFQDEAFEVVPSDKIEAIDEKP